MTETLKFTGRIIAGAYYDFQKIRIETLNRIRDIIRKKAEGIPFDQVEEKKEKKTYDAKYNDKNLLEALEKLKEEGKFTEKEYDYLSKSIDAAINTGKIENQYKRLMMGYIVTEPIYQTFLLKIRGIGPVLSANLIKNFGYCEKFEYVSSLWRYCGLAVINGVAEKRKKGEKLSYSPRLKTLAWKIGDSFIKQNTPLYRGIYDKEKAKQEAKMDPEKEGCPRNKMHCHLRAMRKMVKIFLQHYWVASRELKGLEVSKPYVIEKLKHKKYIDWRKAVEMNA